MFISTLRNISRISFFTFSFLNFANFSRKRGLVAKLSYWFGFATISYSFFCCNFEGCVFMPQPSIVSWVYFLQLFFCSSKLPHSHFALGSPLFKMETFLRTPICLLISKFGSLDFSNFVHY